MVTSPGITAAAYGNERSPLQRLGETINSAGRKAVREVVSFRRVGQEWRSGATLTQYASAYVVCCGMIDRPGQAGYSKCLENLLPYGFCVRAYSFYRP